MTTEAEVYVQPRRSDYGRGKVFYSPKAVAAELAAMIRKSALWTEFSHETNPETGEEFVRQHAVDRLVGFSDGTDDSFYMEIRRSWGVEATLHIRRRVVWENRAEVEGFRVYPQTFEVTLNWSSTGRSIATAQASVALYQELINLGATLTSKVEEYDGSIAQLRPTTE